MNVFKVLFKGDKGSSLSRATVGVVLFICLAPLMLSLLGVDFSNPALPKTINNTTEAVFSLFSGPFTHMILEWTACTIALVTAVLAFCHYHVNKNIAVPIIGLALMFSGFMDAFHTLAASRLIEANADNSSLVPLSWGIARVFHAMLVSFGVSFVLFLGYKKFNITIKQVFAFSLLLCVAAFLIIHYMATSTELPVTQFPGEWITRPYDILPILFFGVGFFYLHPKFYESYRTTFIHSLILMAFVEITLELHMAFGSSQLFDSNFNIAHFLKILAYSIPLIGLMIEYTQTKRIS